MLGVRGEALDDWGVVCWGDGTARGAGRSGGGHVLVYVWGFCVAGTMGVGWIRERWGWMGVYFFGGVDWVGADA